MVCDHSHALTILGQGSVLGVRWCDDVVMSLMTSCYGALLELQVYYNKTCQNKKTKLLDRKSSPYYDSFSMEALTT